MGESARSRASKAKKEKEIADQKALNREKTRERMQKLKNMLLNTDAIRDTDALINKSERINELILLVYVFLQISGNLLSSIYLDYGAIALMILIMISSAHYLSCLMRGKHFSKRLPEETRQQNFEYLFLKVNALGERLIFEGLLPTVAYININTIGNIVLRNDIHVSEKQFTFFMIMLLLLGMFLNEMFKLFYPRILDKDMEIKHNYFFANLVTVYAIVYIFFLSVFFLMDVFSDTIVAFIIGYPIMIGAMIFAPLYCRKKVTAVVWALALFVISFSINSLIVNVYIHDNMQEYVFEDATYRTEYDYTYDIDGYGPYTVKLVEECTFVTEPHKQMLMTAYEYDEDGKLLDQVTVTREYEASHYMLAFGKYYSYYSRLYHEKEDVEESGLDIDHVISIGYYNTEMVHEGDMLNEDYFKSQGMFTQKDGLITEDIVLTDGGIIYRDKEFKRVQ